MDQPQLDAWHMRRALELAALGRGAVEPNPMVGCVVARGAEIIGEGWHRRYGGPHAEIEALAVAGHRAAGATMYVNLEPCCHQGKTPPCTKAVVAGGIRRLLVAQRDPFPAVAGGGLAELEAAGLEIETGLCEDEARRLNAPYFKLLAQGRPWIIAKWAMTLDGKIATRSGESRWISGESSRRIVHQLRGRVDAILVGRGTVSADDPLLLARPAGPRVAARIVADTRASLASGSRLVQSVHEAPVIVAAGSQATAGDCARLRQAGCEVLLSSAETHAGRLADLLTELGRRRMTNVLVEGGGRLLGSLLDEDQIDEVHAFIAPCLVGGTAARSPIEGGGIERLADAMRLEDIRWQQLGDDLYVEGRVRPRPAPA